MTWKAVLVLALLAQPAAALSRATTAEETKIRAFLANVTRIENNIAQSHQNIARERRKLKRNYAAIATEEKEIARLRLPATAAGL